jgi:hypothetical protein
MTAAQKNANRNPFRNYGAYVLDLKHLAQKSRSAVDWNSDVVAALNGQANVELRRVASLKARRRFGAFFTGTDLGSRLIAHASFDKTSVFCDASCGMGDLLLAAAKKLPLCKTLPKTLRQWGQQLTGTDLHREFVEGARTRLVLLARQRHKTDEPLKTSYAKFFPHIRVADGLKQCAMFKHATHFLLNPPFGLVNAPTGCEWAGGRITESAIFIVTALERAKPGTEVLAILPDVLRSGSFSQHWRNRVSELAEVHLIEPYGIFDDNADVDVFLLRLIRRGEDKSKQKKMWPTLRKACNTTVADYFDVHVGRVVPHRDKKAGPRYAYIHPRCVPTWTVMTKFSETRKHEGLVYKPPFVVIRRTSRPGHPYRATATVIAGKRRIAVENHLIVCEPKDRTLKDCCALIQQLKTETVNKFLNKKIRCRHLTVGAVMAIPFKPKLGATRRSR